jgi:hypothetical protein
LILLLDNETGESEDREKGRQRRMRRKARRSERTDQSLEVIDEPRPGLYQKLNQDK